MTFRARGAYAHFARNIFTGPQLGSDSNERLIQGGRPFIVDGVPRWASPKPRRDWLAVLTPNIDGLSSEQREILASSWLADALDEHASVASFACFSMQLLALGAPPDLLRATQRATIDEIAHAEMCFGLASAYADRRLGPGVLDAESALEDVGDLEKAVLGAIGDGCIGETQSAMIAVAAAEQCTDDVVTKVLRQIAADETRHAGLAWRFVQWALDRDASLATLICDVFEDACSSEPPPDDSHGEGEWLRAHGRLSASERVAVATHTRREVIRPCALAITAAREPAHRILDR